MNQFPGHPLDLDLHNFTRDSSGYHRIERTGELHQSIRRLNCKCRFTGREADDEDSGELQPLVKEVAGLAQRSRELFERIENLKDRLGAHREFGEELEWDYDSEEAGDTRLINNSSDYDFEIAKAWLRHVAFQAPDSGTGEPALWGDARSRPPQLHQGQPRVPSHRANRRAPLVHMAAELSV